MSNILSKLARVEDSAVTKDKKVTKVKDDAIVDLQKKVDEWNGEDGIYELEYDDKSVTFKQDTDSKDHSKDVIKVLESKGYKYDDHDSKHDTDYFFFKKIKDSARAKAMNKIRTMRAIRKLRDSDEVNIDEAVDIVKEVPVDEMLLTVAEVLKEAAPEAAEAAAEEVTEEVIDSNRCDRKVIDALKKKLFDTESTEDALAVATEALKEASPVEVVTATMEILDEVSERIPEE